MVDKDRRHPEREGDALLFRTRLREVVEELSEDERLILKLRWVWVCGVRVQVLGVVCLRVLMICLVRLNKRRKEHRQSSPAGQ